MATKRHNKTLLTQVLGQTKDRLLVLETIVRGVVPETPQSAVIRKYLKRSRHWTIGMAGHLKELEDVTLDPGLEEKLEIKILGLDREPRIDLACNMVSDILESTHAIIRQNYGDGPKELSVLPGIPDVPYEPPPKPVIAMSGDSNVGLYMSNLAPKSDAG